MTSFSGHKTSIFLVKSPLQFLNAIEARNYFGINPHEALFVLMGDRKSMPQLWKAAEACPGEAHVIDLGEVPLAGKSSCDFGRQLKANHTQGRGEALDTLRLSALARAVPAPERLFLGDYRYPLMRHFAHKVVAREVILLDDGNAALQTCCLRREGATNAPVSGKKKIKLVLKKLLFGLNQAPINQLNFFSVYTLDVKQGDTLYLNKFCYLRERMKQKKQYEGIFFIGSPLVESGYMNEEQLFLHFEYVSKWSGGQKIVYVPHRREDPQRVSRIAEYFSFELMRFDLPIELQLAILGPKPKILGSFFSSALVNCHVLFDQSLPVFSFALNPRVVKENSELHRQAAEQIYAEYRQLQDDCFTVVDLPWAS